ncbi:MAG: uroporphyrinogen decarboxylase, partial [Pseudomonadota bacterium]|nr:uroporphyrinogen decarboxylase [Pseudomonadota bacterium]
GVALQGNLDPSVLFAPPERIEDEVQAALQEVAAAGTLDGHVFNLGHGLSQYTPPEHVGVFVDAVHAGSRRLRSAAKDQA